MPTCDACVIKTGSVQGPHMNVRGVLGEGTENPTRTPYHFRVCIHGGLACQSVYESGTTGQYQKSALAWGAERAHAHTHTCDVKAMSQSTFPHV